MSIYRAALKGTGEFSQGEMVNLTSKSIGCHVLIERYTMKRQEGVVVCNDAMKTVPKSKPDNVVRANNGMRTHGGFTLKLFSTYMYLYLKIKRGQQ